jgi:hypothetical protein
MLQPGEWRRDVGPVRPAARSCQQAYDTDVASWLGEVTDALRGPQPAADKHGTRQLRALLAAREQG